MLSVQHEPEFLIITTLLNSIDVHSLALLFTNANKYSFIH